MCPPQAIAYAVFAISAAQQVAEYKAAKDQAADQRRRNEEARKSANRAYLADLSEIDRKTLAIEKKEKLAKEGKEIELMKAQDKAALTGLESGNANVEAQLRDIGFGYQSAFKESDRKIYDSNIDAIFGYDDAYSAMNQSYSKLPTVSDPSGLGLAIGIAGSAASTYGNYKAGKYGSASPADLNKNSVGSAMNYNKKTYGWSKNAQRKLRGNY